MKYRWFLNIQMAQLRESQNQQRGPQYHCIIVGGTVYVGKFSEISKIWCTLSLPPCRGFCSGGSVGHLLHIQYDITKLGLEAAQINCMSQSQHVCLPTSWRSTAMYKPAVKVKDLLSRSVVKFGGILPRSEVCCQGRRNADNVGGLLFQGQKSVVKVETLLSRSEVCFQGRRYVEGEDTLGQLSNGNRALCSIGHCSGFKIVLGQQNLIRPEEINQSVNQMIRFHCSKKRV